MVEHSHNQSSQRCQPRGSLARRLPLWTLLCKGTEEVSLTSSVYQGGWRLLLGRQSPPGQPKQGICKHQIAYPLVSTPMTGERHPLSGQKAEPLRPGENINGKNWRKKKILKWKRLDGLNDIWASKECPVFIGSDLTGSNGKAIVTFPGIVPQGLSLIPGFW